MVGSVRKERSLWLCARLRGLAPVLPLALAAANVAASDAPLTLQEAARQATAREPGAVALLEQAAAFDEMATAVAQLPDPQVRFGAANLPLEGGDFRTEGMSQAQLGIRQTLPSGASRVAARARELALAQERRAQAEERRRAVRLAVRKAWLHAFLESRSRRLVQDSQPLFVDLATVTRSLFAVGAKSQQDVLRAELELSQLRARLIAIDERETVARADMERWLGAAASRPLATLPAWEKPPPLDDLQRALNEHPALAAATARLAVGDAGVALAQSRFRPNWTLDASYGYRDGGLLDSSSRSDFFSVTATLSAPLFAANLQQRGLRAAEAQRRGAAAGRDELRRRLESDLLREHGRCHDLERRLTLYEDLVLAQARATADAALSAYRSETADFSQVMRSYIDDLEARLAHIRLTVERGHCHVELAYLGGFEL